MAAKDRIVNYVLLWGQHWTAKWYKIRVCSEGWKDEARHYGHATTPAYGILGRLECTFTDLALMN